MFQFNHLIIIFDDFVGLTLSFRLHQIFVLFCFCLSYMSENIINEKDNAYIITMGFSIGFFFSFCASYI